MQRFALITALVIVSTSVFSADNTTFETTSVSKQYQVNFHLAGGIPKNSDAEIPVKVLVNRA